MTERKRDPLDDAFASLPRDLPPQRDLWPTIEAELHGPRKSRRFRLSPSPYPLSPSRLAASVLLAIGVSVAAYLVIRPDDTPRVAQQNVPAAVLNVEPVTFGPELMGVQYQNARAELDRMFERRLQTLPPQTRDRLRSSLDDLQRSTREISAVLSEHPSDPLLQQLLISAYQNELRLLADVADVTNPSSRVDL